MIALIECLYFRDRGFTQGFGRNRCQWLWWYFLWERSI